MNDRMQPHALSLRCRPGEAHACAQANAQIGRARELCGDTHAVRVVLVQSVRAWIDVGAIFAVTVRSGLA